MKNLALRTTQNVVALLLVVTACTMATYALNRKDISSNDKAPYYSLATTVLALGSGLCQLGSSSSSSSAATSLPKGVADE